MASPQRLSLERSMNQFRRELTDAQEKDISSANRKAINHEIQKVQAKLGREKSLCRLSRIEKFLDAMEHIEKLVTIFLNVSEAVAFIWGPIKLVLMVATAWTGCIKKLLDVYEEVADTLDNLTFFQALIKRDAKFSRMLEDYFSDILRFHYSILDFFSRPDWKAKFKWVWGGFRGKIQPIIESLKRKQAMLSDDKLQPHAILKAIEDSDAYARDQLKQINSTIEHVIDSEQIRSQRGQEQEMKSFLERKLNVSLPQVTSQSEVPDPVTSSSGSWIFSDPLFQSWEVSTSPQGCVLFLTGCPGAGKSTLAKKIIHHLNERRSRQSPSLGSLIYFFFKYNDANRRSTRSMLCHIITQIINVDDAMMRFAYERCSSIDYLDLPLLKSLAMDCLASKRDSVIIIDGLDEGNEDEPQKAIRWCLNELLTEIPSRGCHVRLLICGQEDGRIEPLLSPYPQIRLHTVDLHQMDIREYCKAKASAIASRFRLPSDEVKALIHKVTEASNGMFLYTKVVLANLLSMGSKKEFKAELGSDYFPRNLDAAYGRIVQRVVNSAEPSAQASAKKIFGLLASSERPLRWREIQSRFCIDADEALCDPDDLRADTCKQLCSSLVETMECDMFPGVKSEQIITIVHETARKYLVYSKTTNLLQEHIDMSLFCCRYLSSRPFLASESTCIEDAVQSGYFSFMDYAAAYYRAHIRKADSFTADMESDLKVNAAEKAFIDLKEKYRTSGLIRIAEGSASEENGKSLDLAIQDRVLAIRKITNEQRNTLSQNADFQELEGPRRYKCSRLLCPKFFFGYSDEATLQRHLASHERPFRCQDDSCFAHTFGYATKQALLGHNNAFHDGFLSRTTFPVGRKSDKMELIHACKVGDLGSVKSLHLLGASLLGHSHRTSPLKVALKAGHSHICKYLIDNGVSPLETSERSTPYKNSPLRLAVEKKDIHMLELFLFGYQDLITDSNMSLISSCVLDILTNFPSATDLLLQLLVAGPSVSHSTAIRTIIAEQLGTLFGTWGREVTSFSYGQTVVGHRIDTKFLHKRFSEIFPNLYDQHGMLSLDPDRQEYKICQQTFRLHGHLLHDAFLVKRYSPAAFLMDIDDENLLQVQATLGNMPLHLLILESCKKACSGCIIMVHRLTRLDGGRFTVIPNEKGKLPIHLAIEMDASPAFLGIVVDGTKDLNRKDEAGNSPLHYARYEDSLSILLRSRDVDLFSRNSRGRTAFAEEIAIGSFSDKDRLKILECHVKADIRLAWTADETPQMLTPLQHALREVNLNAAAFLLGLPEVEHILQAFPTNASGTEGPNRLRQLARRRNLEQALKAMDKIGFGLPGNH